MTIPLLPASPSTSSPLTFATDMDAWIASLNPWTEAVNATGSAFAASVSGTSTSSVLVGTGSKSLTVQTGLGFVPGMDLVVAYTTTPTTRMLCTVTSYNNTTGALVVSSYSATGSGTYTAWTVSFTSAVDPVQFVTPTGTQTLTNKTINLSSNTFLATSAQLAAALGDETGSGSVVFSNSPTFTGEPLAPTAAADTNSTQIATTAFVDTAIRGRMRLTASGAITSGQVVVLNSDSTISPVSTSVSSAVLGSEQTQVAAATQWTAVCSIGSTGYTVFADATNVYVGLIDGNTSTMTIGAGVAHGVTGFIQLVYHPVENKVLMFYSSSSTLYCRVGTISGTTFTWSTAGVSSTVIAYAGYNLVAKYNTHQNKVVVLYCGSGPTTYAMAAHLSGTTVTYGTPVYIISSSSTTPLTLAELPGSAYMLATGYYMSASYAVGIFVNALAVSMTAYTLIGNSSESYAALAYHVPSAKFIACSTGKAHAITYPGTSAPTVHPATVITAAGYAYYIGAGALYSGGLIYDPGSTDVIAIAVDSAPNTYLYGTHLSVSGTTVVVGTSTALNTSSSAYPLTIYDTLAGKVLTLFRDAGDSNYGHSLVWEAGNLVTNAGSWIGIAAANISNGATGIVDVPGGISNAVSGLVPGRTYYIDDAGALQQTGTRVIGTAVTATKLLLNGTNASYASLGIFTSAQLAASLSDETGTGLAVFSISPTLTTPTLGVATATTINKVTITTPDTGATLTIADGKTLTALKTFSFTAADDTGAYTLPTGTKTLVATDVATLSSLVSVGTITTGTWNATAVGVQYGGTGRATGTTAYGLIAAGTTATGAQQTLAAGATTEILVGGGESALPVWTTATGLGAPVRANSPTLTTPILDTESVAVTTNNLPTVRPTLNLDFANSKIVDPRITFTRASTATRINASGLLETVASGTPRINYDPVTLACKGLLIEEARTNLLTYSEQFDNAAWIESNVAITADAVAAPDGTISADMMTGNGSGTNYVYRGATLTQSTAYTLSCYLRPGTEVLVILRDFTEAGTASYNINTGVVTGSTGIASNATITRVSDVWVRVSCVFTPTIATGNHNFGIVFSTSAATSNFYLWGAQLEAGAFATSYVPSAQTHTGRASTATFIGSNGLIQTAGSGVARYQYNPLNLTVAPFLLLEAAATNLLTYSEQFDNAAWVEASGAGTSITPNTTAAPDGTTSADTITDADAGNRLGRVQNVSVVNDSVTRTFSVFIKKTTGATSFPGVQIQFNTGGTLVTGGVTVNTNDGSVTDRSGFAPSAKTVLSVGEYWRVSVSLANNSSGNTTCSGFIYPAVNTDASGTWVTTTTGSVTVWGAQLEASNYATSYIPTTSAQVTRVADSSTSAQVTRAAETASMTGTNFSSWFNAAEGTFNVGVIRTYSGNFSGYPNILVLSDGTVSNRILAYGIDAASIITSEMSVAGVSQLSFVSGTVTGESKFCIAYKLNDSQFAVDGSAKTVDSSCSIPTVDRMAIGHNQSGGSQANFHISRISYRPKRLASATLQALSTP